MKTVHEVSEITGVSVRALHHYDAIGLLKPSQTTGAGYRLYDDKALCRLQNILLFRELQFSLKEIKEILDRPGFDTLSAIDEQIKLLEMEQKHIGELIKYAYEVKQKGVLNAKPDVFKNTEMNKYKEEVKAKWGNTKAYKECEMKHKGNASPEGMMEIFGEFGKLRELSPADDTVQAVVLKLQNFITENCYTCTKEILSGLGEMYAADGRFKDNIDSAGGDGTAEFARDAIKVFCEK